MNLLVIKPCGVSSRIIDLEAIRPFPARHPDEG
jgi:hypothetical protein